jgi:hypothetical protein
MEHAGSLTPSEAVYLALSDRRTTPPQRVIAALKAAIAAKQRAGEVALATSSSGRLELIPTGKDVVWPNYSLESRLRVPERLEVSRVVYAYLARDRTRPWKVAERKIEVGLALRGLAKPYRTWFRVLRYRHDPMIVRQAVAYARSLPEPSTASEFERVIRDGVNQRRRGIGGHESLPDDPWMDELPEDQDRGLGSLAAPFPKLLGRPASILFSLALYVLVAVMARAGDREIETAVVVLVLLLWALPDRSESRLHRFVDSLIARSGSDLLTLFSNRSVALQIGVPILSVFATFPFGWMLLAIAFLYAASSTALANARRLSRDRIVRYVSRTSEVETAPPIECRDFPTHVRPVTMEIRSPADLQPPSELARGLVRGIRQRGPAVRSVYYRAVASLILGSTVTALAIWNVNAASTAPATTLLSVNFVVLAFAAALLFILRTDREDLAGKSLLHILSGVTVMPDVRNEARVVGIRPIVTPLIGAVWAALLLAVAPAIPHPVIAAILLAFVSGYLGWLAYKLRSLEKSIPAYPPLDMLALRVFGTRSLEDFLEVTRLWRWLGTTARLDGPDTAGTSITHVWAGVRNRVSSAVVASREQLQAALASFSYRRDWQLRYATNSMQCDDSTWRAALEELLTRADLVIMDLSGFKPENRGCSYELAKILDEIALDRVTLLINEATDIPCLQETLQACANDLALDSPNRHDMLIVELLQLGQQAPRANESLHEWRARLERTVDQARLAAFLVDRALKARKEKHPDQEWTPTVCRWCRPPLPGWALAMKAVATAALVGTAAWQVASAM